MRSRVCGLVAALLLLLASRPVVAGEPALGPPLPGRLYLNVGVQDVTSLDNLKDARAAAFQSDTTHVIQLDGPITAERREALRSAGIVVGEYLPAYAYVADLKAVAPAAIGALPFVTWVGEFQPAWKLDPELGRRAHSTPERQELAAKGFTPVIITLFAGRGTSKVVDHIGALPGNTIHYIEDEAGTMVISATLRAADVAGLARLNDVVYVEEAPELTQRNATTTWIVQSNVSGTTPVWAHGLAGVGQVLGHMDGKINTSHCAFFDPVNNTVGPSHRKIIYYNEPLGYDAHGTHTADTGAGDDYNGSTGNTRGMAYGAKIAHAPIPAFTETGFYNAALAEYNVGARSFTNSWGNDGTTSYDGLCRGIDRFCYEQEETLVCFAVTNTSTLKNPENAKNLLAVGASRDTPQQDSFCSGGTGPTADGRRKPEIYAPGCSTTSASGSGAVCSTATMTGTSMASPVIAGMGLLVREYYMDGFYPTGAATPANAFTPSGALIKATMLNSAVDMTNIAGWPSNQEGWGRLLLDNGLYFSGDARKLIVPADIRNAVGLSTGQQQNYNINVNGSGQSFKVTLVWTDPPALATTGTANAAINDLDLEVVDPSSNVYLGNVFSGGVSATGGTKDAKNNVEMVLLNAPALGTWTVRVKAAAVNSGLQGFALVVTGDVSAQAPAPTLTSITPNTGASGSVVTITDLKGTNFQLSGTPTVKLTMTGQPDINGSGISVVTSAQITCNFDLTAAEPGAWDVVLINPDLQQATLPGGFTVSLSCLRGDMNRDGIVDGADIARFAEIFVNGGAIPVERCAGDLELSPDGQIDDADVSFFVDCVLNGGC